MASNACFSFSGWHSGDLCEVVAVSGSNGIGVKVVCLTCKVLADVQAIGGGISPAESFAVAGDLPAILATEEISLAAPAEVTA